MQQHKMLQPSRARACARIDSEPRLAGLNLKSAQDKPAVALLRATHVSIGYGIVNRQNLWIVGITRQ